jgi:hypothetical protein
LSQSTIQVFPPFADDFHVCQTFIFANLTQKTKGCFERFFP